MSNQDRIQQRSWLLGCGLLLVMIFLLPLIGSIWAFNRVGQTSRYPGATMIASKREHQFLTGQFFWQEDYLSPATATEVYDWYFGHLGLRIPTDQWVDNECFILYDFEQQFLIDYSLGVLVCDAANGQRISVSRSISFRRLP